MKKLVKSGILFGLRTIGFFRLCRHLTRRRLRILCYHGLSIADEHELDDILFMRPETFRQRLATLARLGVQVLPLAQAVRQLPTGQYPDHSVVITFDDGWYSTRLAGPLLKERGFAAFLYVCTGYVDRPTSVFNVLMRYLYWKAGLPSCEGSDCHGEIVAAIDRSELERERILRSTAERMGISLEPTERDRRFQYLTLSELRELRAFGIELGLHTHGHEFPMDRAAVEGDLQENRRVLAEVRAEPYVHFCYPSGLFYEEQIPWLRELGVESATTTRPGSNTGRTSLHQLDRYLDRDRQSELEFEAMVSGVYEVLSGRFR